MIYSGHIGGRSRARRSNLRQCVLDYITKNPGCSSRTIEANVSGNSTELRRELKALIAANEVIVVDGQRNARLHYPLGYDMSNLR